MVVVTYQTRRRGINQKDFQPKIKAGKEHGHMCVCVGNRTYKDKAMLCYVCMYVCMYACVSVCVDAYLPTYIPYRTVRAPPACHLHNLHGQPPQCDEDPPVSSPPTLRTCGTIPCFPSMYSIPIQSNPKGRREGRKKEEEEEEEKGSPGHILYVCMYVCMYIHTRTYVRKVMK